VTDQRGGGPPVAATIAAAVMIAAQVGGKATRDAFFLSLFDASQLPKAMLAAAVLSGFGVLAMSGGLSRFGPAKLVPALFVLSAFAYGGEWVLVERAPRIAGAVVYIHVAVLGSLLISGFWSTVSECFDPHTAKRVIGRITAGATVGGLIGGVTAERVAAMLDARSMLLVLAGMHLTSAVAVAIMGKAALHTESKKSNIVTGFRELTQAPYLRLIGVLVLLVALTSGVIDYAFKAGAAAAHPGREQLMSFFAIFYTATSLVTVFAQAGLSRRVLARLGIGGTIALLPAAVFVGGVLSAAVTRLWSLIVVAGAEAVLSNSLYRSGYELLFTPLSADRKRPTKTLLDVGFDRAGGAIGSGLVLLALAVAPAYATLAAVLLAVTASALAMWVASRLHNGYVQELGTSLRTGTVKLADSDIVDATTRRTLADTTMAIDREQLLAQIEALRDEQGPDAPPSAAASSGMVETVPRPVDIDQPLLDAIAALCSHEPARVRPHLKPPIDSRVVSHVIPLLGDTRVARAARRALRQAVPRVVGQLVDAIFDTKLDPVVRRRLPDLVGKCSSNRAVAGLLDALTVDDVAVRERCVLALSDLVGETPALAPSKSRVFSYVLKDLQCEETLPLPHLFKLLGMVLDTETLELSLSALRTDDTILRGTSYEYLENVLPKDVRRALWPVLKEFSLTDSPRLTSQQSKRSSQQSKRSKNALVAELHQSASSLKLDIKALTNPISLDDEDDEPPSA
jgi:AAA family ATP:ADP antiporter